RKPGRPFRPRARPERRARRVHRSRGRRLPGRAEKGRCHHGHRRGRRARRGACVSRRNEPLGERCRHGGWARPRMTSGAFAPFVEALERGGVVAIATESFFGLLADAGRSDSLEQLLSLKPRGADKGMPLVVPERAAWAALVREIPK